MQRGLHLAVEEFNIGGLLPLSTSCLHICRIVHINGRLARLPDYEVVQIPRQQLSVQSTRYAAEQVTGRRHHNDKPFGPCVDSVPSYIPTARIQLFRFTRRLRGDVMSVMARLYLASARPIPTLIVLE